MPRKSSRIGGGGRRTTVSNKYDKKTSATDYDVNKSRTKVDSIVDHGRDGSSHSHKPVHSIWGVSKGDKISKDSGGSGGGGGSSSSGGSSSGGGDSWCYLTTACVQTMGLPDDCFELQTLRRFRDKILLPTAKGKRAVDEYYKIAPEIVKAVNSQAQADAIWRSVYQDIKKAVALILSGQFQSAFAHYQQMTLSLKRKYL